MASRFLLDDSDSDDSSSGESAASMEETMAAPTRFEFESSSDDEEKRVVLSAWDKHLEALRVHVRSLRNAMNNSDFSSIINEWPKVETVVERLGGARTSASEEELPTFFVRCVAAVIDKANEMWPKRKSLNKINAKNLGKVRQNLKKFHAANEARFEAVAALGDEDEEEEQEEKVVKKHKKRSSKKPVVDKDEDSQDDEEEEGDDDDEEEEDDGEDDEDEDEDAFGDDESEDWGSDSDSGSDVDFSGEITRDYWVKKDVKESSGGKGEDKEARKERQKQRQAEAAAAKKAREAAEMKATTEAKAIVYTPELVRKRLRDIVSNFGRRTADRASVLEELEKLAEHAKDPAAAIKVRTVLIATHFDYASAAPATHMAQATWRKCFESLKAIMALLDANPKVRLAERLNVEDVFNIDTDEEKKEKADENASLAAQGTAGVTAAAVEASGPAAAAKAAEEAVQKKSDGVAGVQYVSGSLYSFVHRLYSEYVQALKNTDHHAHEYVERLRDEEPLAELLDGCAAYYAMLSDLESLCGVKFVKLELIYYRYHGEYDVLCDGDGDDEKKDIASSDVNLLATYLYRYSKNARDRTRALTYQLYFYAKHNHFETTKDMLLCSHVQHHIDEADILTRAYYNRAMAQLGLCAFRCGLFREAMHTLAVLYQSHQPRIKELLAQGMSRRGWQDRDAAKEKLEKMRKLPFHMHMNGELLESVHMISAMLLEVPNMVGTHGRRVLNKTFTRYYDGHRRQAFNGPPESARDAIMAATTALQQGQWRGAVEHLARLSCWEMIPCASVVKKTLFDEVKKVALKVYLLTFSRNYRTISLQHLIKAFEMDRKAIVRIASTMMVNEQLLGAWDEPNDSIVMAAEAPNRLQRAALAFAEKTAAYVAENERLLEQKTFFSSASHDVGGPNKSRFHFANSGRGGRGRNHRGRGRPQRRY